jgi:hypothetical protein
VNLPPPPPDVRGVPVHPLLPEVEPLKRQYLDLRAGPPNAVGPVAEAENRRNLFMRLEAQARAKLTMYQGVRKTPTPDAAKEEQRLNDAVKEARQLREKAEKDLREARADFQRKQYEVNSVEQGLRALLSSFAAGERKPDSYYYLGFEDGSQCFSQNAGPRCDKARAPAADYQNCLASYRLGYTAGETIKKQMLEHALASGRRDAPTGVQAITDSRAEGPCRYEYVMSYNNGYFGWRISAVGR